MANEKEWLEKVKRTYRFHLESLRKNNGKWRSIDTARELRRSIGSISEHLLVASWLKTHSSELEKLNSLNEAIDFIHERRKKLLIGEHEESEDE